MQLQSEFLTLILSFAIKNEEFKFEILKVLLNHLRTSENITTRIAKLSIRCPNNPAKKCLTLTQCEMYFFEFTNGEIIFNSKSFVIDFK